MSVVSGVSPVASSSVWDPVTGADHADEAARVEQVPVGLLRDVDSPRLGGENLAHVMLLAESEAVLPPILVHRETMRVVDGVHRLRAMTRRGADTVAVRFLDGSLNEAFVAAVRVNVRHGLPLTLSDRKAAAARIMAGFPSWSDRAIAATAGLSGTTVAGLRTEMGAKVVGRIGRDGRIRPTDTDRRRQLAGEIIASWPEASLRQIASAAGISPSTARDVRERLKRGEDPMVSRRRQPAANPAPPNPAPPNPLPVSKAAGGHPFGPAGIEGVEVIMHRLQNDPSLRYTEAGRALLRWLTPRAAAPRDWPPFTDAVPPHCWYTLAQLARACAHDWHRLAQRLEQQTSNHTG